MNTCVQPEMFPIGIAVLLATGVLDAVALGFAVATVEVVLVGAMDFAPPVAVAVGERVTVGCVLVAAVAFATLEEGFNAGWVADDGRGFAADGDGDDLAGVAFAVDRGAAFGCFSFGRGVGFFACEGSGLFTSVACSAAAF